MDGRCWKDGWMEAWFKMGQWMNIWCFYSSVLNVAGLFCSLLLLLLSFSFPSVLPAFSSVLLFTVLLFIPVFCC